MNESKIKDLLLKNKIDYVSHGTIWGCIIPSIDVYNNGFGNMMHTMKEHILHFNHHGISIIAVDDMNGIPKESTLKFIPNEIINAINIEVKLTKFILTIQTENGIIKYKVHKSVLACPWHKENLSFLLLKFRVNDNEEI